VYTGEGPGTELARCPDWTRIEPARSNRPRLVRRLDLATGLLREEEGRAASLRFSSRARPGTVALRAGGGDTTVRPRRLRADQPVAVRVRDRRHGAAFERLGSYDPDPTAAQAALADAADAGFERLLREHRETWARRWETADVVVEGDPELQ